MAVESIHVHGPIGIGTCAELIVVDGVPVALCFGKIAPATAAQLVRLIDEHGLVAVPDTVADACAGWPAPSGDPTPAPAPEGGQP